MRTTLKDIAKETGLSIATVSRTLSRNKRTYSKSEEKIYSAARKLGYPFITLEKRDGKTSIALVTEMHQGEFYSSLFNGFYRASQKINSEVIFVNLPNHDYDPVDYVISLKNKYHGICLFLPGLRKSHYEKIKTIAGNYPLVSLIPMKNPKIDTVSFDSYSGGYMVAKLFQERGYTDLGYISGPPTAMDAVYRKNGFIDHINQTKGLKLVWEYEGDFTSTSGIKAFLDFKVHCEKRSLKNIAIFGCNDHACFGFMKTATQHNYSIPSDFIIAGFDNLTFCETITPELTSISTDFEELGIKTIRVLKNMIAENLPSLGHTTMIPVKIIKRKSTQLAR